MHPLGAALAGIVAIVVIWGLFAILMGDLLWPGKALNGADNRPSTSKAQFAFWTALVIWGYVSLAARQWFDHQLGVSTIRIPANLMTVMGVSAGTAVAAKLIAHTHKAKEVNKGTREFKSLFTDDLGNVALEKVQFLAWTLVAGALFVLLVRESLFGTATPTALPDIDATVLTLMGISSGTYLTAKGVSTYTSNKAGGNGRPAKSDTL